MDSSVMPKELRDQKIPLFGCFKEIADFHNDVLMKEVQYYAAEDPSKIGNTFLTKRPINFNNFNINTYTLISSQLDNNNR